MSDDEVHSGDLDLDLLATTGVITKAGSYTTVCPHGPVEFTSHEYTHKDGVWTAEFKNGNKLFAHLEMRHKTDTPPPAATLCGIRFVLRHSPGLDSAFVALCAQRGWPLVSAQDTGESDWF